jgi:pyruvate dehydrogenase E2 component (dihydrolipoamide acetyltransferase)
MAHEFLLPDVGEGLTDVVIQEWLVAVGEAVGLDAPLVQVETDKAVVDIPSPVPGVLLYQGAAAGETLQVGRVLAVVGEPGEIWQPEPAVARQPESAVARQPESAVARQPESAAPRPAEVAPIVGTLPEAPAGGRPQALPAVRKLAADLGVDLDSLEGSGANGRITREDVLAVGSGPVERVAMTPLRRAVAEHLSRSWREIPHVTTYGAARAERLLAERRRLLEEAEGPMPLEALLVALIVPLLVAHPEFNASVSGTDILLRKHYDIGIATDTPDGLLVPVLKNAGAGGVHELADAVIRLAKSARGRTLTAEQMRGATFTVSNIGAVGGRYGTPIIPYGTSAIVSFGRAASEPVVEDGAVVAGMVLPISLSYDHRLIDGALGRSFMAALVGAIEAASFS